jgi:hypothetical protein
METRAFQPNYTKATASANGTLLSSVTVAASVSAATSGQLGLTSPNGPCQVQIANTTAAWAYVNVGQFGSVTAATVAAGYPVAPGAVVVVTVDAEVSGASVILAAGATAGNVIFTRGEGL